MQRVHLFASWHCTLHDKGPQNNQQQPKMNFAIHDYLYCSRKTGIEREQQIMWKILMIWSLRTQPEARSERLTSFKGNCITQNNTEAQFLCLSYLSLGLGTCQYERSERDIKYFPQVLIPFWSHVIMRLSFTIWMTCSLKLSIPACSYSYTDYQTSVVCPQTPYFVLSSSRSRAKY